MVGSRVCFLALVLVTISCVSAVLVTTASLTESSRYAISPSSKSYAYLDQAVTLYQFTQACQFNFTYTSDQEISVWLSVEERAQSLLVLPDGRPCVNETTCGASKNLNPQQRYFLLAENLSNGVARVRLNITAAASSESGCGTGGPGTTPPVVTDYQYVYDDVEGPVYAVVTGAECISYLAVGYKYGFYNFNSTMDVDGFVSTYANYLQWADDYYPDGTAVQLADSVCPSDVPYCTATVKDLNASETYVISIANGYDDKPQQRTGKIYLAYTAGSQDGCASMDVARFFSV